MKKASRKDAKKNLFLAVSATWCDSLRSSFPWRLCVRPFLRQSVNGYDKTDTNIGVNLCSSVVQQITTTDELATNNRALRNLSWSVP